MDVIAFRLHTGHRVAVPGGCALFVRGGVAAWQTRSGEVLFDANHALLMPRDARPFTVAAVDAPASFTLICDPRVDFGLQPTLRVLDSAEFFEHFCLTLSPSDASSSLRLARLVRTLRAAPEKPATSAPNSPGYGRVMQQYVNSTLAEPFELADVAHAAALSPFTASRVFHREAGLPLRVYVRRLRVRASLARIADRDDLAQVALQLGFFDHAHFTRSFRAEFGVTPAQWRAFTCATLYKTA